MITPQTAEMIAAMRPHVLAGRAAFEAMPHAAIDALSLEQRIDMCAIYCALYGEHPTYLSGAELISGYFIRHGVPGRTKDRDFEIQLQKPDGRHTFKTLGQSLPAARSALESCIADGRISLAPDDLEAIMDWFAAAEATPRSFEPVASPAHDPNLVMAQFDGLMTAARNHSKAAQDLVEYRADGDDDFRDFSDADLDIILARVALFLNFDLFDPNVDEDIALNVYVFLEDFEIFRAERRLARAA